MKTPPLQTIQDWLACALSFDANPITNHTKTHQETLADFQSAAVTCALQNVRQFGGTILADAVGLGKTRMGLAIARTILHESPHKTVYIIIPSRLKTSWQRAALASDWQIPSQLQFITHTELSTRLPDLSTNPPAAILVDEAHHFHNPTSNRSRNLAKIASNTPLVLLTATPICNSIWDLYNLLTLFLADHDLRDHIGLNLHDAFTQAQSGQFDLTELARILVIQRRTAPANIHFGTYPSLKLKVLTYVPSHLERWFWRNLEPELRKLSHTLLHHDWPRPLFQEFILKRWESCPTALAKTLQSLVDYHHRFLEAQKTGHNLSRPDFHQLFSENTRNQTVFPFIYQDSTTLTDKNTINAIHEDLQKLENLLHRAQELAQNNTGAISAITNLLDQLPTQKLLIFTSYQHTADAIYRAICTHQNRHARIGLVTGRTASATGLGKTTPQEIIRRFAPIANDEPDLPLHHQLDVLVCTDCLSEGINLQDCSHVLLADLPYTPLRIEQRIGRLMRPTPEHRNVTVYLPRPNDWTDTLGLRRRLTTKLNSAHSAGSHFQNASVLNPTTPTIQPTQPLATLTILDQLANRLNAHHFQNFDPQPPQFFAASTQYTQNPQLWIRAVLENTPRPIYLWCKTDHTKTTEMRTTHLINDLLKLADLQLEITPTKPDVHLLQAATKALKTRLKNLQAARFAPMPLAHDSIQQKIWHQLSTWIRQSPPQIQPNNTHDIDTLRQRILQPFPRGIERTLSDLFAKNPQSDQLFQSIHRLELPNPPKPMKLRILLGLQLNPSP